MGLPGIIRAKYVTGTQDRVVDRFSAKGTWGNADTQTVAGKGHIDLVKPERVDDAAVLILKNFLKMLAAVRPTEKEEPARQRLNRRRRRPWRVWRRRSMPRVIRYLRRECRAWQMTKASATAITSF